MEQITDTTHFLRSDDKEQLVEAIDEFETQFPQFFPAFYLVELSQESVITEFSLWLLNRARVPTLDERGFRESANAFLFVIDLARQMMTVAPGYFAEQCVSENDLRELLRDASPYLEAGDLTEGLCKLVDDLRLILRRNHRLILKSAKWGLISGASATPNARGQD